MEESEVKTNLKLAKEAIKNKEYKEALKHCKAIIKEDKNNYNAFVFIGVAADGLEQSDQALNAYKKAADIDPNQPLAWQGMCAVLEKLNDQANRSSLLKAYEKLFFLFQNNAKRHDLGLKFCRLLEEEGSYKKAIDVLNELKKTCVEDNPKYKEILKLKAHCLGAITNRTAEETNELLKIFKELISLDSAYDLEFIWIEFVNLLVKAGEIAEALQSAQVMLEKYPQATFPDEICWSFVDRYIFATFNVFTVAQLMEKIFLNVDDKVGILVLHSIDYLQKNQLEFAVDCLLQAAKLETRHISVWLLLSKSQLRMHQISAAAQTLHNVKLLMSSGQDISADYISQIQAETTLVEIRILTLSKLEENRRRACQLCADELSKPYDNNWKLLLKACHTSSLLSLGDELSLSQAKLILTDDSLKTSTDYPVLFAKLSVACGDLNAALSFLLQAVTSSANADVFYWTSYVLWKSKPSDRTDNWAELALGYLLRATELDKYHRDVFILLGHIYLLELRNPSIAIKCYQKAYDIEADEIVGILLADLLLVAGSQDMAMTFLTKAINENVSGGAKWALLRLGLLQQKMSDWSAAISSLQKVLRLDSNDVICWESLGEAYLKRGSYTAAMKAFSKVLQLQPDSTYSLCQVAYVKQMLGHLLDSALDYQNLLKHCPEYLPALKGLGETFLLLAKSSVSKSLAFKAAYYLQEAVTVLTSAVTKKSTMSCTWKLLADCFSLFYDLPRDTAQLLVAKRLLLFEGDFEMVLVEKNVLLTLASRCYGMALKLRPSCAALWHDLGLSYSRQLASSKSAYDSQLIEKAVFCLKRAIALDPAHCWLSWNALGVLASSKALENPALGQHCFIKSIEVEKNNPVAWSNLGVLYMKHDNAQLAHEAFKMAQTLAPSHLHCWIGQATIAETVGDSGEALDLFRHTVELGDHPESQLGYGHWVCNNLASSRGSRSNAISSMIPAAVVALSKYKEMCPDDPIARNMLSLLMEEQHLNRSALNELHVSLEMARKQPANIKHIPFIQSNYARILSRLGKHQAAAEEYSQMKISNVNEQSRYALSLLYCGANSAIQEYEHALTMAKTEYEIAEILAALCISALKCGQLEVAQKYLLDGLSKLKLTKSCSHYTDFAKVLCAWLLSTGDVNNLAIVLDKMDENKTDNDWLAFSISCRVHVMLSQKQASIAFSYLNKQLHLFPNSWQIWLCFARNVLWHFPSKSVLSATAASIAEVYCHNSNELPVKSLYKLLSVSSLGAGWHGKQRVVQSAFSRAKKLVHLQPDCLDNWLVLLATALAEGQVTNLHSTCVSLLHLCPSLAAHIMAKVEAATASSDASEKQLLAQQHLWSVQMYSLSLLVDKQAEKVIQFLQQALWLYEADPALRSLFAFINQDATTLQSIVSTESSEFAWKLLLHMCFSVMRDPLPIIHPLALSTENNSLKHTALIYCALAAHRILKKNASDQTSKELLRNTTTEIINLQSQSTAALVLRGISLMMENNVKAASRQFQQVYNRRNRLLSTTQSIVRQYMIVLHQAELSLLKVIQSDAILDNDYESQKLSEGLIKTLAAEDSF